MSHLTAQISRLVLPLVILAGVAACYRPPRRCRPADCDAPAAQRHTDANHRVVPAYRHLYALPHAHAGPYAHPGYPAELRQPDPGGQLSGAGAWVTGQLPSGTIALNQDALTLVVSQERGYLSAVRQNTDPDRFLRPNHRQSDPVPRRRRIRLAICASQAMISTASPCRVMGRRAVDRLLNGNASSPKPWTQNGAIPPGSPSLSQLAVQAIGKQMRFYVNDAFIFEVNDGTIPSGGLGLFARATSDTPVSVSFSNLKIYRPSK